MCTFSGFNLQIKKLDDSEFRNAFSRAYVRVCSVPNIINFLYFYDAFCLLFDWELGEGV